MEVGTGVELWDVLSVASDGWSKVVLKEVQESLEMMSVAPVRSDERLGLRVAQWRAVVVIMRHYVIHAANVGGQLRAVTQSTSIKLANEDRSVTDDIVIIRVASLGVQATIGKTEIILVSMMNLFGRSWGNGG